MESRETIDFFQFGLRVDTVRFHSEGALATVSFGEQNSSRKGEVISLVELHLLPVLTNKYAIIGAQLNYAQNFNTSIAYPCDVGIDDIGFTLLALDSEARLITLINAIGDELPIRLCGKQSYPNNAYMDQPGMVPHKQTIYGTYDSPLIGVTVPLPY